MSDSPTPQIQIWHIDKFVPYARNPRKNDGAVDRMCASIREFGFKIHVLARSDGTVVDGHLRLKAARKLGSWPGGDITGIPVILCDEWSETQVRAFRILVNRSVTWAEFDDELLSLELQDLAAADFDLSLTGFDPRELEDLLALPENDEQADIAPPLPENPVFGGEAVSNVPPKSMRDLRPSERQFVDAMRRLGHGRFESLRIQRGELVLEPPPTAVRSVKFGKPTPNRPEHPSSAFDLKQEVAQLFSVIRSVEAGEIRVIEVRGGLPFAMDVAAEPTVQPDQNGIAGCH
jgi:hypothetical protein